MTRARAAEWMLRRMVGRERAAALVGDQLEAAPMAGALQFWAAVV